MDFHRMPWSIRPRKFFKPFHEMTSLKPVHWVKAKRMFKTNGIRKKSQVSATAGMANGHQ
ncbi:hypothetical protein SGRIM119S_02520 [Streptomyces griseorubiginosus]